MVFMPSIRRRSPRGHNHAVRYQFVDCRWELGTPGRGYELYLEGHIPGASFLDVDDDLSDTSLEGEGRHPLPSADRFAMAAGKAGIADGVYVVAYGSMGGAERLWWLLRHFGHSECAVLLGGIDAWGGPLAAGEEPVEAATFVPRARTDDTIGADEIASRPGGLVVVDARAASRWRGEENPVDKVAGRIPGALSAPWNEELEGLPPGEVVAYCGSGVTACVVLHRLALAGRPGRLYPGSWSQWETLGLPVERG
jgi:thiosulfate/3-mercaptopyruvate sulfurtransferase